MPLLAFADLLAQVPESALYFNPWKLLAVLVLFTVWALFAQWVDKDTVAVNTYRVIWNLIVVPSGIVAILVLLLVPNLLVGALIYIVGMAALITSYVLHRNALVQPNDRVLTAAHIQRVMSEGFRGKKKKVKEVKERVRLTSPDKKVVAIPEDEVQREQFRLTQDLFFDALWRRASLVEIAPAGQAAKVTYLIDGIPTEREAMLRADADGVVTFVKGIARLNMEEKRKPQSGKLMAAVGENKLDVLVRTDGSTAGEKLSLRIVGDEKRFKVKDLGFTDKQLELVQQVMHAPHGIVLICGPQASGITTTLYSFARSHDAFLQNIQTLEYNAKELDVENITQHVFSPAETKTFVAELQKIVRTGPDIVVIPDLRDKAAAVVASQAAEEKQKVYVNVPALDLFDGLKRWMKLVGDNNLLSKSLLAVMQQRLVRKLCGECKQPYKPDAAMLRKINAPADKILHRPPEKQFDKHGNEIICQHCQGTGYVGRSGVFDILVVDAGLRDLLRKGGSFADVQAYAMKKGGLGLQQQALSKVFEGVTSIQEVVRATRDPAAAAAAAAPKPQPQSPTGAAPQPAR
jgi:type II secretory ATPase GspE/PulE/Tfp pilus assembly ATPase PilB-like protein